MDEHHSPINLLTENPVYKPFHYQWAYDAWLTQQRVHWLPEEVPLHDDVKDWHKNITEAERNLLTQIFRFFTQADVEVNNCYMRQYSSVFKPTEVLMMLSAFSNIECFDRETELLTSEGWKQVDKLTVHDRVAQFDLPTKEISFVNPDRVVSYPYQGIMHSYESKSTSICVTPNHDLIIGNSRTGTAFKAKSMDGNWNRNWLYPTTGRRANFPADISAMHRLLIATAADGCIRANCPSNEGRDHRTVDFNFHKERKIGRLINILALFGISPEWRDNGVGGQRTTFAIPGDDPLSDVKSLDFIPLEGCTPEIAAGYLREILNWDGVHNNDNLKSFYSVNKRAVDKIQALSVICGLSAIIGVNGHAGREVLLPNGTITQNTQTCYVVTISESSWRSLPGATSVAYNDEVFCVSVPHQNIVSRRRGRVAITGNTVHIAAYSHLLDTVGMPEVEYSAFLQYKQMKDKYDFMHGFACDTKHNIAKTMAAFGAFMEGLQLFASFAILLNFPRFNKMKGMGQLITWSVRDECFVEGTEILTPRGWVDFKDLTDDDKVAQWDNGVVSFTKPSRRVEYDRTEPVVSFSRDSTLGFCVTPNHDIVYVDEGRNFDVCKQKAEDFEPHSRRFIPVAGHKEDGRNDLTALERVRIAFAADGTLPDERHTGSRHGYLRVSASFSKDRKIKRLHSILQEAGITYDSPVIEDSDTMFRFNAPVDISKKLSDWVNLEDVSSEWGSQFLNELMHWDGHDRYADGEGLIIFGTTIPEDRDLVQAICAISGYKCAIITTIDSRGYKTYYRLSIQKKPLLRTGLLKKEYIPYSGKVRCVTVPSGAIIVRYKGRVCVSGNSLHCDSIIKLFHTFVQENPEIWTDTLRTELYDTCATVVHHEDAFIDLAFEMGAIEGLTSEEVKQYIRYIADRRLAQLGLNSLFNIEKNPLPWLDEMLNSVEHMNFFEGRSTEYSKASTTGTWDDAFSEFDIANALKLEAIPEVDIASEISTG